MSNVYIIENTAGTLSITLTPGTLNGPGSRKRETDLRLYGMGHVAWGEGINENFFRLTENFACPAKSLGDYDPTTGGEYDPTTMPVMPRDERDGVFGLGKGINSPINGQQWFNTSNQTMYVYDSQLETGSPPTLTGGWKTVSGSTMYGDSTGFPLNPQIGDTYYYLDTNTDSNNSELFIYNPGHPEASVDGWVSVLVDYISEVGGEANGLKGDLYMTENITGSPTEYNQIKYLADPTNSYDAVNLHYMEDYVTSITGTLGDDLTLHVADASTHLSSVQNTLLDTIQNTCMTTTADAIGLASDLCALKGFSTGTGSIFTDLNNSINGKVSKSGDTMTGQLLVPQTTAGSNAASAVTKQYVDTQLQATTNIGNAAYAVRYFTSNASGQGQQNGDIYTNGANVYVWAGGAWRQIFPAVYS